MQQKEMVELYDTFFTTAVDTTGYNKRRRSRRFIKIIDKLI